MLTKRRYCFDYVRRRVKGIGRTHDGVRGGGVHRVPEHRYYVPQIRHIRIVLSDSSRLEPTYIIIIYYTYVPIYNNNNNIYYYNIITPYVRSSYYIMYVCVIIMLCEAPASQYYIIIAISPILSWTAIVALL